MWDVVLSHYDPLHVHFTFQLGRDAPCCVDTEVLDSVCSFDVHFRRNLLHTVGLYRLQSISVLLMHHVVLYSFDTCAQQY
jgi:hypothetical protein